MVLVIGMEIVDQRIHLMLVEIDLGGGRANLHPPVEIVLDGFANLHPMVVIAFWQVYGRECHYWFTFGV